MNHLLRAGSAFNGCGLSRYFVRSTIKDRDRTNYVSFTEFCDRNFISKKTGYSLMRKKLILCQRLKGQLWVAVDPDCLPDLLDYLSLSELIFNATN